MGGAAIYLLGRSLPLPGIDHQRVVEFLSLSEAMAVRAYNRELTASAVFSLGMTPLIQASILILLLAGAVSRLRQLRDATGETGAALDRPIYAATIAIALVQGYGLAVLLELIPQAISSAPGALFRVQTVVVLVTGAIFLAWLAGQITRRGLVNGVALIVLINLLAEAASGLRLEIAGLTHGMLSLRPALLFLIVLGGLFALSLHMVRAQHRIPLQHQPSSGNPGGESGAPSIVLRMNMVGIVPIWLAGIAMLPLNYLVLRAGSVPSLVVYSSLIAVFTYLLTAVSFSGADVVAQIRRYGFTLPDVDPRDAGENHMERVVERLVARHAAFLIGMALVGPLVVARLGIGAGLSWLAGPSLLVIAAIGVAIMESIRARSQGDWAPVFEADTELEADLAGTILERAGIPARRVSNRAIPITGTLAFWEMSRPPYPSLTIYRRLGGGGVYVEVPREYVQPAANVFAARAVA